MEAFATLFERIDQTTSTNEKIRIMADFFRTQDPDTCAWALFFLSGQKLRKLVGSAKLRQWSQALVCYPDWMMEDCYAAVGDTAEMVSLILAAAGKTGSDQSSDAISLGEWMSHRLLPLMNMDDESRRRHITGWWQQLETKEVFILNKLLTGSLRIGVSETLVYRALSNVFSLPHALIASRLVGNWRPSGEFFARLGRPADSASSDDPTESLLPLPFCLAAPLDRQPAELGQVAEWQCEWKWDGVRCQIVKAGTKLEMWSRGEECITGSFPDLAGSLAQVPGDWIIDGEVVAGHWNRPGSFQALQKRLNRRKPSAALVAAHPVSFLAYDLLQMNGEPWRHRPLAERREALQLLLDLAAIPEVGLSPLLTPAAWDELADFRSMARNHGAEGVMLKGRHTSYETGRKRGVWFKWKTDPLTIDAVLTAAQPGTGRRASLYTDYTFSLWKEQKLIPVAKAYSGLDDAEVRELDGWIRKNTTERFGPVRTVNALRVFELGFEGISRSERHKSGFAVRFPRILRERTDKRPEDADGISGLEQLFQCFAPVSASGFDVVGQRGASPALNSEQMSFELGDPPEHA